MNPKTVLVEINERGDAVRIFRNAKAARLAPLETYIVEWPKALAVQNIRRQVYERNRGEDGLSHCEWCSCALAWETGHMHETIFKSKGGEVSLENSIWLCPGCHLNGAHGDRKWQTAKRNP